MTRADVAVVLSGYKRESEPADRWRPYAEQDIGRTTVNRCCSDMSSVSCSCMHSLQQSYVIAHIIKGPHLRRRIMGQLGVDDCSVLRGALQRRLRGTYNLSLWQLSLTHGSGLHHLHLPPAAYQLHRRRTRPHHPHDRPPARIPPVAAQPRLLQDRHIRPTHLPRH